MSSDELHGVVLSEFARSLIRFKARQLSRRPGFSRSDQEDLEQEISLYLLVQASRFDPSRASLHTFTSRLVDTAVGLILRRRRRLKRGPASAVQSLDSIVTSSDEESGPLADAVFGADLHRRTGASSRSHEVAWDDANAIAEQMASLSPEHKLLCELLLAGGTAASAGRDLGLSRRQVRAAMTVLRERFLHAGLGDLS